MTANSIEARSKMWNLWHGCRKLSAGCAHCYVYRGDEKRGVDPAAVVKTQSFDAPVQRKKRSGEYKIPAGTLVYTCFTSDFFLEDADPWRGEAWDMIRERSDLRFLMITKRIDRLREHPAQCLPSDWGDGWDHVTICCTVENQDRADYRLPIFRAAPIRHKRIICEPLLERIDLAPHNIGAWAEQVVAGGESGAGARPCNFDWVMELREECVRQGVSFWFKQTGARFIKDGKLYLIPRRLQHAQARRAGVNF